MVKRIVFGVAAAAILIALLIVHGWVLIGFTVAAGLIMTYEILRTIRAGEKIPYAPSRLYLRRCLCRRVILADSAGRCIFWLFAYAPYLWYVFFQKNIPQRA